MPTSKNENPKEYEMKNILDVINNTLDIEDSYTKRQSNRNYPK